MTGDGIVPKAEAAKGLSRTYTLKSYAWDHKGGSSFFPPIALLCSRYYPSSSCSPGAHERNTVVFLDICASITNHHLRPARKTDLRT